MQNTYVRTAVALILGAVATFFWGFLYWTVNPLPYQSWKQVQEEKAARESLKKHFPESGVYSVPNLRDDQEELGKLHEEGPVAFVYMRYPEGGPMLDSKILMFGLLLNLVAVAALAFVFRLAARARPLFETVRLGAAIGVFAAILINFGDAVWWGITGEFALHKAIYTVTFCIIASLVLGLFNRNLSIETAPTDGE